jgi:hypothetical protein
MERPERPDYKYGWKYRDNPNTGADYESSLRLYTKDLEKYCDWLEKKKRKVYIGV